MSNELYQFNLSFQGHYIQGYKLSEDEGFVQIKIKYISIPGHNIKPIDDIIHLSKSALACYFKINQ